MSRNIQTVVISKNASKKAWEESADGSAISRGPSRIAPILATVLLRFERAYMNEPGGKPLPMRTNPVREKLLTHARDWPWTNWPFYTIPEAGPSAPKATL
jgi:hypothetical protein